MLYPPLEIVAQLQGWQVCPPFQGLPGDDVHAATDAGYGFLFSVPGSCMPSLDYRQVRSMISMRDVLDLLGFVVVVQTGNQVRGACPLHESAAARSRVFSVHLTKNTFRCFKCQAAGNQLDLWAAATKQPTYEAALDLCARLGHPLPTL